MRIAFILLLLTPNLYAQSIFHFTKGNALKVTRTIAVSSRNARLARRVLEKRTTTAIRTQNGTLRATYKQQAIHPTRVVGTNNYLKGVSKRFKGRPGWETIHKSRKYNGAHHIVTKYVIKELGFGKADILNNAPSVFHPLHNHPDYIDIFHDHARQLEIYKQSGVRGVVIDFFERVNQLNKELGLPEYDEAVMEQALLEAELWAKHWGLKW